MRYKKIMMLTIILACLPAVSAVSAAENATDYIVSADVSADVVSVEGTTDEVVSVDDVENDNSVSEINENVLNANPKTFADLNKTINGNDNSEVYLTSNYTFDLTVDSGFIDGVVIDRDVTVYGNGFTLDGGSAARIFNVENSNVVFRDIVFVNGKTMGDGGAIYGYSTAINCIFKNNYADNSGGAMYGGSAVNCIFVNNSVHGHYYARAYTEHIFYSDIFDFYEDWIRHVCVDYIGGEGGAMYLGSAVNCSFINNFACFGGAMHGGQAIDCRFIDNEAKITDGADFWEDFDLSDYGAVDYMTTFIAGGGAVYFKGDGAVTNCIFIGNTASDDEGGAVYFDNYGAVENCNFTSNKANDGGAIFVKGNGKLAHCNFINNSAPSGGGAVVFKGNASVVNCNFANNSAAYNRGGAVYFYMNGKVSGCNFVNDSAVYGGAITFEGDCKCTVENSNFMYNKAEGSGGAIDFGYDYVGTIRNCNFIGNNAGYGSAISFGDSTANSIYNSVFLNNTANLDVLQVAQNGNNIEITFMGKNNLFNAIGSNCNIKLTNVTYWGAKGIENTGKSTVTSKRSYNEAGQNVTVVMFVNGGLVLNETKVTDTNGKIVFEAVSGNCTIIARHGEDSYYTQGETAVTFNSTSTLDVGNIVFDYGKSGSSKASFTGASGIIAYVVDSMDATVYVDGNKITVSDLDAGSYTLSVTTVPDENYIAVTKYVSLTVNKLKTRLTASSITTTYGADKNLVITLKDSKGKPLKGVKVSVVLNGDKQYSTDKNGQIKVSTKGLVPKTYTAKITLNDNNYVKSTKNVKITVKKATPKMTAAKKTFKKSVKTKKYAVTLKANNKAMKSTKVYIKINKKTYSAKTNNKGVATFKLTKLTKKGKYAATITYKGSNCYNKLTKKAKIGVR